MKKLIFSTCVTAVVVVWLAVKLDWRMIWQIMHEANLALVSVTLFLQIIIIFLCAIRWRVFFTFHKLSVKSYYLFCVTFIGAFFNNLLPSTTGGDAVRGYYIYKEGFGSANAIFPIVVERIVGLMTTLAVAAIAVQFVDIRHIWFDRIRLFLPLVFFTALCCLFLVNVPAIYSVIHGALTRFGRHRLVSVFLKIVESMHLCFGKISLIFKVGVVTVMIQLTAVAVVWLLAISIGSNTSFLSCLAIAPVVFAVSALPITIGGFGLREGAMITLFSLSGMEQHHAASMAIFFAVIILFASFPGFVFFLSEKSREAIGRWNFLDDKRNIEIGEQT